MPWFIYSFIAASAVTGAFLCVRRLTDLGFSPRLVLVFNIAVIFLGFAVLNVLSGTLTTMWFAESFPLFLGVMVAVGVVAMGVNLANYIAVQRAPNPGYARAIISSSPIPLAILSVLFFQSPLGWGNFLGTVFMLAGVVLLVLKRNQDKADGTSSRRWLLPSFLALAGMVFVVLGLKEATLIGGFGPNEINFLGFGTQLALFALFSRAAIQEDVRKNREHLGPLFLFVGLGGLFSMGANYFIVMGIELAPNPAYHEALFSTNVLYLTLLSVPLLGLRLERRRLLGVVAVLLGVSAILLL